MGITRRLAQFVTETDLESLPWEAVTQGKRALVDTLGVTLAGCGEEGSRIVAQWLRQQRASEEASVLGYGFRTAAADAALANATFGHSLDYDDVNISMCGHPSIPVALAALALAEKQAASGRQVITAFVLGFEVEAKVGRVMAAPHYALGWHPTATLGSLGAAAACAKLLGLSAQGTTMALAIAASLASGLRQNFGTMTKPLHAGLAARNGIMAAQLAALGFTADPKALEGPNGFLDAILELRKQRPIPLEEIDRIEVRVSRGTSTPLIAEAPITGLQGKFNLAYCLASALLDGQVGLTTFRDEAVQRPEVRALMTKVQTTEDNEAAPPPGGGWAEVGIRLKNGREQWQRVDAPRGSPQRPLSWDQLVAKFNDCTRQVLTEEGARQAVALLASLDSLGDVRDLMELLGLAQAKRLPSWATA